MRAFVIYDEPRGCIKLGNKSNGARKNEIFCSAGEKLQEDNIIVDCELKLFFQFFRLFHSAYLC